MNKVTLVSAKDLDISFFVGSGKGGQNKQKNSTGVQIVHRESGSIGRCSETRSQYRNKITAFNRMATTGKFKLWLNRKLYELQRGETIEKAVDKMMLPVNLEVQVKRDGKWENETIRDSGSDSQE